MASFTEAILFQIHKKRAGFGESVVTYSTAGIRSAVNQVQQLAQLGARFGIRPENVVFQSEVATVKSDVLGEDWPVGEDQRATVKSTINEGMPCQVHRLADEISVAMGTEVCFGSIWFLHDSSLAATWGSRRKKALLSCSFPSDPVDISINDDVAKTVRPFA